MCSTPSYQDGGISLSRARRQSITTPHLRSGPCRVGQQEIELFSRGNGVSAEASDPARLSLVVAATGIWLFLIPLELLRLMS